MGRAAGIGGGKIATQGCGSARWSGAGSGGGAFAALCRTRVAPPGEEGGAGGISESVSRGMRGGGKDAGCLSRRVAGGADFAELHLHRRGRYGGPGATHRPGTCHAAFVLPV